VTFEVDPRESARPATCSEVAKPEREVVVLSVVTILAGGINTLNN